MSNSIWARVKAAVTRAIPAPADPQHDKHVIASLQQQARENDLAMPPAPTGMRISEAALAAVSVVTPDQRNIVAAQLAAISPPSPTTAADLLPHSPEGVWR